MLRILKLTLLASAATAIYKAFSIEATLLRFVVLGQIPGTNIQLNFWVVLLLSSSLLVVLARWFSRTAQELAAYKLSRHHKDANRQREIRIAAQKEEHYQVVAQQLDIEELRLGEA